MDNAGVDAHDVIVIVVDAAGGQIEGRTVMQKLVYFSTVKTELPISYKHYFYGPFSGEVAMALDEMVAFLYLDEVQRSTLYDRYKYILTSSGREYVDSVRKQHPSKYDAIKRIVDDCKDFRLKSKPLSLASKVHYIMTNGTNSRNCTSDYVQEVASTCYGWKLSDEDIDDGFTVLKRLGFADGQ